MSGDSGRGCAAPAAAAAALLVATTTLALRSTPLALDRIVFTWLNDPARPVDAGWSVISPMFRPLPLFVVTLATAMWILATAGSPPARRNLAAVGLAAGIAAWVLSQALKVWVGRSRPPAVLAGVLAHGYPRIPAGQAFPSSHAAVAVALLAALWPLLRARQRAGVGALAVAVTLDRAYIGAHWPLDLLGGFAVGVLVACGVLAMAQATRMFAR